METSLGSKRVLPGKLFFIEPRFVERFQKKSFIVWSSLCRGSPFITFSSDNRCWALVETPGEFDGFKLWDRGNLGLLGTLVLANLESLVLSGLGDREKARCGPFFVKGLDQVQGCVSFKNLSVS